MDSKPLGSELIVYSNIGRFFVKFRETGMARKNRRTPEQVQSPYVDREKPNP